MLETLDDPASVVAELRRVTKSGGVVGAASVDYGGLIIAGAQAAGARRFYDIRNKYGVRQELPSRIWVVACAGFSTRRDSRARSVR
jgi:hypothetical protein